MISIYKLENKRTTKEGKNIAVELRGLSTDDKPTIIENQLVDNGSSFIEIDTGKVYLFDLENKEWKEI